MSQPALTFLPWVRRGGALALPPDLRTGHPASHVGTTAGVTVNNGPSASVPVQLLGPGAVTGVSPQQVIRSDPAPNTSTFESNYLALVEFDDPGLPWLFTPASASGGKLRPWLCLVVVREDLGATGLTDGFAVPHAKDASIAVPALIVWRNETSIAWPSFDGQPVDIAVALFVPAARDKEEHIRLLSKTAVLLMDEDFRALLRTADDPAALAHAINERIGEA